MITQHSSAELHNVTVNAQILKWYQQCCTYHQTGDSIYKSCRDETLPSVSLCEVTLGKLSQEAALAQIDSEEYFSLFGS